MPKLRRRRLLRGNGLSGFVVALGVAAVAGCGSESNSESTSLVAPSWTTVDMGQLKGARLAWGPRALNDQGEVAGLAFLPPLEADKDLPPREQERVGAVYWAKGREPVLLPTLDGRNSAAEAINASGQIAGWSSGHAVLWENGKVHDLGPGTAVAITDNGIVIGTGPGGLDGGFIWKAGKRSKLDFIPRAVNKQGQVVGFRASSRGGVPDSWPWDYGAEPMAWENGKTTKLLALEGNALGFADGINESGQIAGVLVTPAGEHHLVIWEDGEAHDLGVVAPAVDEARVGRYDLLTVEMSMAFINDRGDVAVSTANADGVIEGYGAFLAEDGELRALPKEMSSVAGMNEESQVIGSGRGRAFVWTDGQLVQLPTTGLDPRPSAINDRGDVAGTDGGRAVLWSRDAAGGIADP